MWCFVLNWLKLKVTVGGDSSEFTPKSGQLSGSLTWRRKKADVFNAFS